MYRVLNNGPPYYKVVYEPSLFNSTALFIGIMNKKLVFSLYVVILHKAEKITPTFKFYQNRQSYSAVIKLH